MASVRKREWTHHGKVGEAWICDYFDADGKRRQKTFKLKKAADAFRTKVEGELVKGTHTPESASKTVAEAGSLWIEQSRQDGLEPSSIKQYEQHLKLHIAPFLGTTKLSQLTAPMVNKFVQDLRRGGRSEAMARKVLTSLKTLVSHAHVSGLVAQNVAREVKIKSKGRHKKKLRVGDGIPTKSELRTILEKAPERWRPILVAAIFTGMRASELRGLTWKDVDLDAKVVRVTQRADLWSNIGSPKSAAGGRTIPLAPIVINTLREWKLKCPTGNLDLVFPNDKGNVQDHSAFYGRHFVPLLVDCEIVDAADKPKFTFHALRHAAASMLIEQGWQPKKVQEVMGHSSITVTYDTYGHLFPTPEDDHEAMAQVEARLLA